MNLVTPIPAVIARPLIEGLRNESIVHDSSARQLFPHIQPAGYRITVEQALAQLEASNVETTWSDALSTSQGDVPPVTLTTNAGTILEHRQRVVPASPTDVYKTFIGLGGKRGWFYLNWAWEIRGRRIRTLSEGVVSMPAPGKAQGRRL